MAYHRVVETSAAIIVWIGMLAGQAAGQTQQRAIVDQLLSQDPREVQKGLSSSGAMAPEELSDGVRGALIALLELKNAVVERAAAAEVPLDAMDNPELIAQLSRMVATLHDPRAIPSLAKAIYGGAVAVKALAEFGEAAVPPLVQVVMSSRSHYNAVDHALSALTLVVRGATVQPLSQATRNSIREAAKLRLVQVKSFTTLWKALELTESLRDPELTALAAVLAEDRDAIVALGITEPRAVEITQQKAKAAMAGAVVR